MYHKSLAMVTLVLIFLAFSKLCTGIVYIDRFTEETNPSVGSVSYSYTHDADGNCVANTTINLLVTITKVLIYIRMNLPEDHNDRNYRKEVVKTVIN